MNVGAKDTAVKSSRFEIISGGHRLVGDEWRVPSPIIGDAVLAHGGGQTRHAWHDTAKVLAAKGWDTIAYDARGHGESEWRRDRDYSRDGYLGDMLAMIARCKTAPVLVGASLGGMTSLLAAGEYPDKVRAIVLVDIALSTNNSETTKIRAFMDAYLDGFPNLEAVAEAVHAYNPLRRKSSSLEGLKRNVVLREDGRWYWRWDPAMIANRSEVGGWMIRLRAAALKVRVPTLLVRGDRSHMIDAEALADFRKTIPHAEVVDIHGAGHMVAGDDNNAFSVAVIDFLDRLTR